MDLEEEGPSVDPSSDTQVDLGKPMTREESKVSQVSAKSPRSPVQLSRERSSIITAKSDDDDDDSSSAVEEAFQTPPTSATVSREDSWRVSELNDPLKASVSVSIGSEPSIPATPTRNEATSSASPEKPPFDHSDDVDADERDLLEQTGLLEPELSRTSDHRVPSGGADTEEGLERRERPASGTPGDRSDRSKIRRSLQRTLREGAGLSHHRHRRAKDSTSNATLSDDANRDTPDVLPRGTGSFVVHGKKASVITFGNELQMQALASEERIRQRMQRDDAASSRTAAAESTDFQSILTARSVSDREHRGSGASASTATARSFRELHRKFSSAHAANRTLGGNLALPSDEDSDAAVSFSEGRHTPLPPIDGEEEREREESQASIVEASNESADRDGVEYLELSPPPSREGHNTVFFTPEPPSSPVAETSNDNAEGAEQRERTEGSDPLASPPLQAVSA
jgi:hypothetical protein